MDVEQSEPDQVEMDIEQSFVQNWGKPAVVQSSSRRDSILGHTCCRRDQTVFRSGRAPSASALPKRPLSRLRTPPHISSRSKDRVASSASCGRLYRVPERMTTSRRLMRREDQVYASSMFNLPSNFNAVDICTTSAWQKSQTQTFFPSFFLRTSVLSIFVQPPPGGTRCSSVEPSQ